MQTNLPYNSQSSFPIGFRFAPFDDEIIVHYLLPKVTNQPLSFNIIEEVNVYKFDPQTLSEQYVAQGEDKWYFFSTREKVNKKGGSNNKRTTGDFGFWRVTDSPHSINHEGLQIGSKTTLVYYRGKSSDAKKTNWIMHEFEAKSSLDTKLDDIVVCRIYERKASNTRKRPRVEEVHLTAVPPLRFKSSPAAIVDVVDSNGGSVTGEAFRCSSYAFYRSVMDSVPFPLPFRHSSVFLSGV
ncbi:NAC domain-containing protein 1-like [Senna tora]|uniref:NAC domain-containing protein 1-like n=1 Tax=Senna tora TaxID=362788 RepID=A0A835CGL2_9FABA|nr:NAC domain-containing protein 1-like [Senna tora]